MSAILARAATALARRRGDSFATPEDVAAVKDVLRAIREPDEALIKSGAVRLSGRGQEYGVAARDCWRSMVDWLIGE